MKNLTLRASTLVASLALVGATALVASPSAMAAPVAGAFSTPQVSGLAGTVKLPKSAKTTKTVNFSLSFSGTYDDKSNYSDVNGDGANVTYQAYDVNYKGGKIALVSTNTAKKGRNSPYLRNAPSVTVGTNGGFSFQIYYGTTPGLYEIRLPVTQFQTVGSTRTPTTRWAVKRFKIKANAKLSKSRTSYYASSWRIGKTATWNVTAPAYETGAKIKLYYKATGARKYKAVASGKIKVSKSYTTLAVAKVKTKKLTKSGKIYFKVAKTKYAPAYKTKVTKIKVKHYYY